MKVLHIIDSLSLGGAERHLTNILEPLRDLGVESTVLTLFPGDDFVQACRPFARLVRLSVSPRTWPLAYSRVRGETAASDLVHTNLPYSDILGRIAAHRARRPVVSTLHSTRWNDEIMASLPAGVRVRSSVYRWLDGRTARLNTRFIAVSEAVLLSYVGQLGISADKTAVIPTSVDLRRFSSASMPSREVLRRGFGFGSEPALLLVGKMRRGKGHEIAIRAVAAVKSQGARLYLAGDGPLEASLRKLAEELQAPVTFLGPQDAVASLLHAADLFVFPTFFEGLPVALIEAMAVGTPIVCSDLPETREVAGDAAVYVPTGEVPAWAAAIRELVSSPQGLASRRGAGLKRVHLFDVHTVARAVHGVFREALSSVQRKVTTGAVL